MSDWSKSQCPQLGLTFCRVITLRKGVGHLLQAVLLLAWVSLLTGCASVKPAPFQAFSKSVQQLRAGTDKALATNESMATERFMREALETTAPPHPDPSTVEQLRLAIDKTKPFSWGAEKAPLFIKAEQFRAGASQATNALMAYSELLVRLSSPDLLPQATFDQLTSDLNANAYGAVLAVTGSAPNGAQVALFSTVAAQLARGYLESQRRSKLVAALEANQASVEVFAKYMQKGVEIAAAHGAQEYEEKSQELFLEMITPTGPAPEAERRAAIQGLIDLDRKYIEQLSTLQSLYDAFGQVSNAHAELVKAAADDKLTLSSIPTLLEEGKRLESLYEKSVTVNKVKATQATADKVAAQAERLEAEAETAQLRADHAQAEAERVKGKAEADPSNAATKARAAELQEKAQKLQENADRKKKKAEETRKAADEAQKQADEIKRNLSV